MTMIILIIYIKYLMMINIKPSKSSISINSALELCYF